MPWLINLARYVKQDLESWMTDEIAKALDNLEAF